MKFLSEIVKGIKFFESFKKEISEAVAPADIQKILSKYSQKLKDPNAQKDFFMQAATFLGRQSSVSADDLELALRKHYAKNFDPAKLARGQTPGQKATTQASQQTPPPLPSKTAQVQQKPIPNAPAQPGAINKPAAQTPQQKPASPSLPPLSKLAANELDPDPVWKKYDLPPPSALGQKPSPHEKEEDDDIPMAKSSDVKRIKPKSASSSAKSTTNKDGDNKEVDMDKLGEKEPAAKSEKPLKSAPGKSSKKKEVPQSKDKEKSSKEPPKGKKEPSGEDVSTPTLSSLVKRQSGDDKVLNSPKVYKPGDVINLGNLKGLTVDKKKGDWYLLRKGNRKYAYNPSRPYLGAKRLQ